MQTQEILSRVNEIISLVESNASPLYALKSFASDLEAQVRHEYVVSNGVGNAAKTIVGILKDAEKDHRHALAYPWVDAEGRQCICNGFVAFRLRNHLPLPERPEDAGEAIDLDRIFPSDLTGYKTVPMPSAKELRAFIAIERAKQGRRKADPVWDFGEHKPAVNARYLLQIANVFPNAAELFWVSIYKPLVFVCDTGDCVICPIRLQGKTPSEEEQKAEAERRETIRKALDDRNAAQEEAASAQTEKNAALIDAEKANSDDAKDNAMKRYYDFAEAEGRARLRSYAAARIADPEFDITPDQFGYLVRLLHAREDAQRNAS